MAMANHVARRRITRRRTRTRTGTGTGMRKNENESVLLTKKRSYVGHYINDFICIGC